MAGSLEGRVALVTGAAGGLGSAVCAEFGAQGAAVVGVDVRGEGVLLADISNEDGNRLAVETALARYGRLDILVLNAAVQHVAPIAEFPTVEWDRLMGVLLKGPFLSMKAAWAALTARPGGRIIATASTSAFVAEPYKAAYIAAKHGLLGLVKVAAMEGGPCGLTANAVAPGLMMTGLIEGQMAEQMHIRGQSRDEILSVWCSGQAIKRPVDTAEVAATIGFLAGDRASGITGAVIPVDLGELACGE
jgi:3-hydroxybutyrate dehydrogenase